MFRACSRCGKIHDSKYKCHANKINYTTDESKYRNQRKWKKKSVDIRERANYLCEVCKDQGVINYNDIEVHHIEKIKDNKDRLIDDYNLICLCSLHHRLADSGKIDSNYLKKLACEREEKNPPCFF